MGNVDLVFCLVLLSLSNLSLGMGHKFPVLDSYDITLVRSIFRIHVIIFS